MKKILSIIILFLIGLSLLKILSFNMAPIPNNNSNNNDTSKVLFNNNYAVYSLSAPENINFAGESVPLYNYEC